MKAIHNWASLIAHGIKVGNYKLKYNFESNSQHKAGDISKYKGWEL